MFVTKNDLLETVYIREKALIGCKKNGISGMLPISRSTLWNWVKSGKIKTYKLGPRITVFAVDEVRALLDSFRGGES